MIEASGIPPKTLQVIPGAEVSGEVLSKQPNGRFLVRVNGEVLDMALPGDTKIGVTLKMTYVGDQPRLTFAISSQTVKGSDVNISTASRWLGSIASSPTEASAANSNQNLQRVRLFETLPADNGAIALKLKETVRRSGLFYESHLQRWADGSYPIEELLQEPQGQLSALLKSPQEQADTVTLNNNKLAAEVSTPSTGTSRPESVAKTETSPLSGKSSKINEVLPEQVPRQEELIPTREQTQKVESNTLLSYAAAKKLSSTATSLLDTANSPPLPPPAITAQREKPLRPNQLMQPEPTEDLTLPDNVSDFLPSLPLKKLNAEFNLAESSPASTQAHPKTDQVVTVPTVKEVIPTKEPKTGPTTVEEPGIARPTADDKASKVTSSVENSRLPGKTVADSPQTAVQAARPNLPDDTETATHVTTSLPKDVPSDLIKTTEPGDTKKTELSTIQPDQTSKSLPQPADALDTRPRIPLRNGEHPTGRQLPLISPEIPKLESIANYPKDMAAQPAKLPTTFEPPDSQTLPVIRQQLEMLHSGQFIWQGEAWQGQQMKWAIRRDEHQRKPTSSRSWDTELHLELPGLGAVAASITIMGEQVRLSVSAADASSAKLMESHRQRLVDGMESGGLTVVSVEVKHEPTA
jgi:hypothetical protein